MRILKFLLLPVLVVVVFVAADYFQKEVIIKSINCRSQYGPCSPEIVEGIYNFEGKSYKDAKSNVNEYLKNIKIVDKYKIFYKPLQGLSVDVVETKAHIALKVGEEYLLTDMEGNVLALVDSSNLPTLNLSYSEEIGSKLDKNIIFALNLIYDINTLFDTNTGDLYENRMETLVLGKKIIFPLEGDREVIIGALRLILKNLDQNNTKDGIEMNNGQVTIDLRYKNPIIKNE